MKNILRILVLFVTASFIAFPNIISAQQDSLKVLSWNIYMLPLSVKSVGQAKRVQYIAEQMNAADYDIIVFQEAFERDARYRLSKLLRKNYPYQEGPANAKPSFLRMNSGVWILSKHPMKFLDELDYKRATGVDRVARKGALLVEINKNGKTYHVAGTHLQAGASRKKDEIRHSQFQELQQLLHRYEVAGVPQLVCGDFNTPMNDRKNYNLMLETLKVQDGPLESSLQYTYDAKENDLAAGGEYREVLDYILLKDNSQKVSFSKRRVIAFTAKWHEKRKSLSDHYAVEIMLVSEP
jgi:endonuclease/exonuclease/phosphatase family metal-dependent hydrolase